jgi:hypothetical protein
MDEGRSMRAVKGNLATPSKKEHKESECHHHGVKGASRRVRGGRVRKLRARKGSAQPP